MRIRQIINNLLTFSIFISLLGCNADGILEDLNTSVPENTFCPTNRLENGLCPSTQTASISNIEFTSVDNSYGLSSVVELKVIFNKVIKVTGTPHIQLETGVTDRYATYYSGSSSKALIFKYTVAAGDLSTDLDYNSTSALSLNGGTIKNLYGNASILNLPAVGTLAAAHAVVIDTIGPTLSSVDFSTTDGAYGVGSIIDFKISYNEPITVTGIPRVQFETGITDRYANFVSVDEATTGNVIFRYIVQVGDTAVDLTYLATTSLTLSGGTIKDATGNIARLILPAPADLATVNAVVVETVAPQVTAVAFVSANGNYAAGATIGLKITFDEAVTITGSPQVELETGTTDRFAIYQSGSGSVNIVFRYTVVAGDVAVDLDYKATNSLGLNSGTIKDAAGNNAILSLPAVGLLGAAHDIGAGVTTWVWDFTIFGDYTYNTNYVEVTAGKASLKTVDTLHSGIDFNSGGHVGTFVDGSGNITLLDKPTASATHVNTILPGKAANLVGYWRMDGDFLDSSGNGNNAIETAVIPIIIDSKVGTGAADMNGASRNLRISDNDLLDISNNISISFWIKFTSYGSYYAIHPISKYGNTSVANYILYFFGDDGGAAPSNKGKILFLANRGGTWGSISGAYKLPVSALGTWQHIGLNYNATTGGQLYINGNPYGARESIGGGGLATNSQNVCLGSLNCLENPTYSMDEVSIWNTDITDAEMKSIYQIQNENYTELSSSWTPKWNNIVGYWKMDGNWQDSSGNGNSATPEGGIITSISDSKVGVGSALFDGVDDALRVGSITGTNPLSLSGSAHTISTWFKAETGGDSYQRIIDKSDNSSAANGFALLLSSKIEFWSNGTKKFESPDNFIFNIWTHVVVTSSVGSRRMFINGVMVYEGVAGGYSLPPAVTTNMSIGSWNHSTAREFKGQIDDLAIWSIELNEAEVSIIYNRQKQKYAGHYDSPVIDLGTAVSWDNLKPKTRLPFYKELPSTSESSSDYSALSGDLKNGLVGYWPLNELVTGTASGGNDYKDSSGNGNHGINQGALMGTKGQFSTAIELNGTNSVSIPDSASLSITGNQISISAWINYTKTIFDTEEPFVGMYNGGGVNGFLFELVNGRPTLYLPGVAGSAGSSGPVIAINTWINLVAVYDGSNIYHYQDGILTATNASSGNISDPTNDLSFGRQAGSAGGSFDGLIDEVAIWSRALTAIEVDQLYRRGGNRIKYQVKSCVDSSCNCSAFSGAAPTSTDCNGDGVLNTTETDFTGMANWLGSNGSGTSFSELQNCSTLDASGNCSGDVNKTPPDFNFVNFPLAAQPANKRYFQYRILMEAEENTACTGGSTTCMPELESVEIGPTGRYYGGSPDITPATSSVTYTNINNIVFTNSGTCTITYQISKDNSAFKYWDGSAWAAASGVAQSSSAADISSNIGTFTAQAGAGTLYWKAFLTSDTSQDCHLENISVTVPD